MSVTIRGTDNSTSTPAVTGTDGDTGMFFPAADTIAFAEGGAESMRLTSAGTVGIGTTTPAATLDVRADNFAVALNVRGRASDNFGMISFSTAAGGIGSYIGSPDSTSLNFYTNTFTDRMTIDSAGRVTARFQPSFQASATTAQTSPNAVMFSNVIYNVGSHFNSGNGRFTAPVAGRYLFNVIALDSAGFVEIGLFVNGSTQIANARNQGTSSVNSSATISAVVNLNANDYVIVFLQGAGTSFAGIFTQFSGHLLS